MGDIVDIKTAQEKRDRLEAYHIGESVLFIYERVFGMSILFRESLSGAADYAEGKIDDIMLAIHRANAQHVVERCATLAVNSNSDEAWVLHPGLMAAYCILQTLDDEIDLKEVQRKANEAFKYAPTKETKSD